jgi:hypothetical protein
VANEHGWPAPSYDTVYSVIRRLDPALVTLAHHGSKVYSDRYDLLYRREAAHSNAMWQADHTPLDMWVPTEAGVDDPQGFALQWHILMKGSIVAAGEGDHAAAPRGPERSVDSSSATAPRAIRRDSPDRVVRPSRVSAKQLHDVHTGTRSTPAVTSRARRSVPTAAPLGRRLTAQDASSTVHLVFA